MTERTERLSLGEVQAITRDALMRAGATRPAADATAWAVHHCEKIGARSRGLERVPHLLEGIHMSGIRAAAQPSLNRYPATVLQVDADFGLSDAAMAIGLDTLQEIVRSFGSGVLSVVQTGDTPVVEPWLARLAERQIVGMFTDGTRAGTSLNFCSQDVQGAGRAGICASMLLQAATGQLTPAGVEDRLPFEQPVEGSMCIVAFLPSRDVDQHRPASHSHVEFDERQRDRQLQADAKGVDVSSELLLRILTA